MPCAIHVRSGHTRLIMQPLMFFSESQFSSTTAKPFILNKLQLGVGNIENFISWYVRMYIEKKYCNITIYHNHFLYFYVTKLHAISLNKEISYVDDIYLKLKSKHGTLLGYKFHPKFDDFYSFLCRKKEV